MPALKDNSIQWFESMAPDRLPLLRLFCFPYAGGNAHVFRSWQQYLPAQIDVCLVHLPGRARRIRERPHTDLQTLKKELADALQPVTQGRFAFYGHSMGALISFELARELRRRGCVMPLHLFLSACRAPTMVRAVPRTYNLPDREFISEIRKLNGTPKEFFESADILSVLMPLLRADFQVTDTYEYVPERQLACPITVYGGDQDQLATIESLDAWNQQTTAECRIRVFPGDHFFIHSLNREFLRVFRQDLLQTISLPACDSAEVFEPTLTLEKPEK